MTHFIGAVLVPAGLGDVSTSPTKYPVLYGKDAQEVKPDAQLSAYLAEALAPFDENMEYEAWTPKAEVIAKSRANIEEYRTSMYEKARAEGREAYAARVENKRHVEYLFDEFPAKLEWDDEQVYADCIKDEAADDVRASDGAVRTTYNPASKWDWWTIGGRWEEAYRDQQGQSVDELVERIDGILAALEDPEEVEKARVARENYDVADKATWSSGAARDAALAAREAAWEELKACPAFIPWSFPYSVVHPVDDGEGSKRPEWTEKGKMGWFGLHDDAHSDESWLRELKAIGEANGGAKLYYIDFHI